MTHFGDVWRNQVKEKREEEKEIWRKIWLFHNKLKEALRLNDQDVSDGYAYDIEVEIGDYIISTQNRCTIDGWWLMLEARPNDLPHFHGSKGFDGEFVNEWPDVCNWFYRPKGTSTQILPFENVQEEILNLIRESAF